MYAVKFPTREAEEMGLEKLIKVGESFQCIAIPGIYVLNEMQFRALKKAKVPLEQLNGQRKTSKMLAHAEATRETIGVLCDGRGVTRCTS